jgi:hypothetical protein
LADGLGVQRGAKRARKCRNFDRAFLGKDRRAKAQ